MIYKLKTFFPFFKDKKNIIIFIFFLTLVSSFSQLYSTYILGHLIDLIASKDWLQIKRSYILLIVIKICALLLGNFLNTVQPVLQADIVFRIEQFFLAHIKKLPIHFFDTLDPVYLNTRLNQDANELVNTLLYVATGLPIELFAFLFIFIYFLSTEKFIFLMLLLSIPTYISIYFILQNKVFKKSYAFREEQNKFFAIINLQLDNIPFIKLNSIFSTLDKDLQRGFSPLRNALKKYSILSALFDSLFSTIDSLFFMLFLIYGIYKIYNNEMTIGNFLIIQTFFSYAISSMASLTAFTKQIPDLKVSINRLLEIYTYEKETNGTVVMDHIDSITLSDVSFKHILHEIDFTFENNNIYCLSGSNGKGKTTLLKCILGLYVDEFEGNIFYNDKDIRQLDMYSMRKNYVSYVDQECFQLYNDVDKNIGLYEDAIDLNVTKKEYLLSLFKMTKGKYLNFSGGERQKLSIIRAFLKSNSSLLIFDEPTSSLDYKSKIKFLDLVDKYKLNKIIIIISHDDVILNNSKYQKIEL